VPRVLELASGEVVDEVDGTGAEWLNDDTVILGTAEPHRGIAITSPGSLVPRSRSAVLCEWRSRRRIVTSCDGAVWPPWCACSGSG
jgi:hypothetical protein